MFKLLKNLRDKEAADRVKLIARYRDILELGDAANPKQVEELSGLMETLGYDAAQVEKDAKAVANLRFLVKLSAEMPARQARHLALVKARGESAEHLEKTIKAMARKHDELVAQTNHAETEFHEARRAADRLAALNKEFHELFGIPERIDAPPPGLPRPINLPDAIKKAEAEYE